MEDQRERVADASFAFVRRHHLRWLALSLVELAPQHHLSPLHLLPSEEKEDTRWLDIIKMDKNGDEGSFGGVNADKGSFARADDANGSFARANAANGSFAHSNADKDPCVWLSPINRTF
jgi:hypothetical protein